VLTLDDLAPVLAKRRMLRHSNSGAPLDRYWSFALADGEVSFVGEPAAIVLAESRYVAEDAAAMVAVDYDVLASVGDARRAIEPTAPAVRRELNTNIAAAYKIAYGDIDAAFAAAAYVFHEDLWQHRGGAHPIEGRGILAEWREDSMTVWASTQKAHDLFQSLDRAARFRSKAACAWQLPMSAAASVQSSASTLKTSRWWRRRNWSTAGQMDRDRREHFHQRRSGARPILVARHRGGRAGEAPRHPLAG
jgi:hypothetical protein